MSQAVRLQMARLARIDGRLAELHSEEAELLAERARVFAALGEGTVDLVAQRRAAPRHVPELPAVSELDRQRARRALQDAGVRRRVGR